MTTQLEELINRFGHAAVALVMVVENVFPPIPSEPALLLAGVAVGEGRLGFAAVVAAATLGSVLGALILYWLSAVGGRPLLDRHGRRLGITPADVARAERWFARWGPWLVLGARVVPFARSVVSIPAGLVRMPVWQFTILSAAGSLVWNVAVVGAGWALGDSWERAAEAVGLAGVVAATLVAAILVPLAGVVWRRRRSLA